MHVDEGGGFQGSAPGRGFRSPPVSGRRGADSIRREGGGQGREGRPAPGFGRPHRASGVGFQEVLPSLHPLIRSLPRLRRRSPVGLGLLVWALAFGGRPAIAQGSGLFSPGERWAVGPPAVGAWIPRDVTFTAAGELVWAATSGSEPEAFLSAAVPVADPVLYRALGFAGAVGPVQVAAGPRPDRLYTLHQLPVPGEVTRHTLLRRYDAEHAAHGNAFAPRFTHELGSLVNAPPHLAIDRGGDVLVCAAHDAARGEVVLERLDPVTGALLRRSFVTGSALRRLALSADGRRLAMCAGTTLWVLDEADAPLLEVDLPSSGAALALSFDGRVVTWGDGSVVRVFEDEGAGYVKKPGVLGLADDFATALALTDDGGRLAVAWWDSVDQAQAGLEVHDLVTGGIVGVLRQSGGSPALQNVPVALELSADASRALLGLWGSGDASPELVLVDVASGASLLEVDLPGSPYALALAPGGRRFACARKDAHANLFSTSGELQLFETGERELCMLDAPRPGASLRFQVAVPDGASAWVLAGFDAGVGRAFPTYFDGLLWIDPTRPLAFLPTSDAGGGEVRATVDLPSGTSFVGLELAAQAWFATAGGPLLGATVVRPVVL